MSKNHRPIKETYLRCTECDNIHPIYRIDGRMKSKGHRKHIYCWKCKKGTLHLEIGNEWELVQMGETHDGSL